MHTFFSSSCRKRTDTGSVSCCSLVIPISATCFTVFFVYPLFSYPLHLISPHPPRSSGMHICCLPASTVTWYSLMNTGTRLEQTSFHCCHAPPPQVHCHDSTMLSEGVEYSYPIFIAGALIDRLGCSFALSSLSALLLCFQICLCCMYNKS